MTVEPERVNVALAGRSYDILIGQKLLRAASGHILPHLKRDHVVIVTDENVAPRHLPTLEASLKGSGIDCKSIILPAGEPTKSFQHLALLCDQLLAAKVERRDVIIALGGGVIGDLTGFAAAILRRGVNFIQIPTTLLAQVDSSVGGKTGINSAHGKNLIGVFHQPLLVLADLDCLKTLPAREMRAGYAEVVKYGLLGDSGFFDWLQSNAAKVLAADASALAHAVRVCCGAKARIVAEDETETGVRALLNLGHTFGHAYEAATGYSQRLLHGEAISVGMVQAFRYSEQMKLCKPGCTAEVVAHFKAAGLPVHAREIPGVLPPPQDLLELMKQDKKAVGGRLTFILVRGIGEAFVARDVDEASVLAFLESDLKPS